MDIVAKIREKSREQWIDLVREYVDDIRIWVEDNGVKASAVALVVGMVVILFLKLFISVIAVAALAGLFIWSVSIPEAQSRGSATSRAEDDSKKGPTH